MIAKLILMIMLVLQLNAVHLQERHWKECNTRPTKCGFLNISACGKTAAGVTKDYSSPCYACQDLNVVLISLGKCPLWFKHPYSILLNAFEQKKSRNIRQQIDRNATLCGAVDSNNSQLPLNKKVWIGCKTIKTCIFYSLLVEVPTCHGS